MAQNNQRPSLKPALPVILANSEVRSRPPWLPLACDIDKHKPDFGVACIPYLFCWSHLRIKQAYFQRASKPKKRTFLVIQACREAWSLELGVGTWNLELGAWNLALYGELVSPPFEVAALSVFCFSPIEPLYADELEISPRDL